jgi:hypothetical protein
MSSDSKTSPDVFTVHRTVSVGCCGEVVVGQTSRPGCRLWPSDRVCLKTGFRGGLRSLGDGLTFLVEFFLCVVSCFGQAGDGRRPCGGRRPACGRASGIEARMRVLWIDTMRSLPVAAVLLIATAVANGVGPSEHLVPAVSIAHDHDSAVFGGRALAFASGSAAAPPVSGVTARSLPFATPRLV